MKYLMKEDLAKIENTGCRYNNIHRDFLEPIINGHCDAISFDYKERGYADPWLAVKSIKVVIKKYGYIELNCCTLSNIVYVYRKDCWNEG